MNASSWVRAATGLVTSGALAVLGLAGTGCPSGGGGSLSGAPIPFDQFGKVTADKLCAAIQSCCDQNGFSDEVKGCNAASATSLQASVDEQKSKHPDYVYDAQKAGNCVAAITAVYSTCNFKSADTDLPECDDFFRGAKSLGASCTSSNECASSGSGGVRCAGATSSGSVDGGVSSTGGVCVATKKAADGDPCLGYSANVKPDPAVVYGDCESGSADFYCNTTEKKCKPRGGAGTVCVTVNGASSTTDTLACAKGFSCDYTSKACVALPGVGEACLGGYNCAEGAYCDQGSKKCAAKKAGGEACGATTTADECLHGCDTTSKKCRTNDVSRKVCAGATG